MTGWHGIPSASDDTAAEHLLELLIGNGNDAA
jgi:hypothetical protein